LLIAELSVVQDFADGRSFDSGDFDQVQTRLAGKVHRLRCRHDAQLFAVGADQSYRADADLLVDPVRIAVTLRHLSRVAFIGTRDTRILLRTWPTGWAGPALDAPNLRSCRLRRLVARLGPASSVPAVPGIKKTTPGQRVFTNTQRMQLFSAPFLHQF